LCESPKHWAEKCPIRLYKPPIIATESTGSNTETVRINTVTVGKVSVGVQTISTVSVAADNARNV